MNPYEIDLDALYEGGGKTITWRGRTCWKNPCDMVIYAELVAEVQPALVIETGTHMGGSAVFWRDLMDVFFGVGEVITIDVRDHGVPYLGSAITKLLGSSTDPRVIAYAAGRAQDADGPVLVNLDSDHNALHVAHELEAYAPLVTPGSYLIVEDGCDDFRYSREGPHAATMAFLEAHPGGEADKHRERLGLTNCPDGFLRRLA